MPRSGTFGPLKKQAYLDNLRKGLRRGESARAVGIDPETVRYHAKADATFAVAIEQAEIDACEQVESALFRKALEGNIVAIQVWLYNRNPDRWRDKRNIRNEIEIKSNLPPEQMAQVQAELLKKLAELPEVDAS